MEDYRTRIYKEYASHMQGASLVFDKDATRRWGIAYDTYLKEWLPKNRNVAILEVGCGWGRLLYFFRERGYLNLKGVDISSEQVQIARQVIENVTEGDAIEYLEKHPESFDLIVGLDIIEHFKKDEVLHFLEACSKALRLGGRLILQTPNAESPWGMNHRYNDFTHEIAFNPNSLKRLLALVGFADIVSRETGPVIHGVVSFIRYCIWKCIWALLAFWNLAETGGIGSGIYSRVFLISGIKKL